MEEAGFQHSKAEFHHHQSIVYATSIPEGLQCCLSLDRSSSCKCRYGYFRRETEEPETQICLSRFLLQLFLRLLLIITSWDR
jgi:hypothetical protein